MSRALQLMVGGRIPLGLHGLAEVDVRELLGVGGFGSVWKVVDTASGRPFVLKVIQGIKPGSVIAARVRLEAEVRIPSEHIVPPLGLCEWDPSTFLIVFEHFEARDLADLLAARALGDEAKRRVFAQILQGVADAHACNVIHRDLKPENVLVAADGRVKLIDIGIAKLKGAGLTVSGELIGTPPYMAPELFLIGAKVADARSDVYALGQILYELAMGHHFWERQGWSRLGDLLEYLSRDPAPEAVIDMAGFRRDFLPYSERVLPRMVRIEPTERPGSVHEVIDALGLGRGAPAAKIPRGVSLDHPLLIVETGSNRDARTLVSLRIGERREMGRYDFAGADESLSRRHVELSRGAEGYFVRDLGSKHGTMLCGRYLDPSGPRVPLQHADRIKLGEVFLRFAFTDGRTS